MALGSGACGQEQEDVASTGQDLDAGPGGSMTWDVSDLMANVTPFGCGS